MMIYKRWFIISIVVCVTYGLVYSSEISAQRFERFKESPVELQQAMVQFAASNADTPMEIFKIIKNLKLVNKQFNAMLKNAIWRRQLAERIAHTFVGVSFERNPFIIGSSHQAELNFVDVNFQSIIPRFEERFFGNPQQLTPVFEILLGDQQAVDQFAIDYIRATEAVLASRKWDLPEEVKEPLEYFLFYSLDGVSVFWNEINYLARDIYDEDLAQVYKKTINDPVFQNFWNRRLLLYSMRDDRAFMQKIRKAIEKQLHTST